MYKLSSALIQDLINGVPSETRTRFASEDEPMTLRQAHTSVYSYIYDWIIFFKVLLRIM